MRERKPLPEATLLQLEAYRQRLLTAGFLEGTKWPGNFYRMDTEWTAFAVNLKGWEDGVRVEYGFASTAFIRMKGNERALIETGCTPIDLMEQLVLLHEADTVEAESRIQTLYSAHHGIDRETLHARLKALRNAFVAEVAARMKALGFHRKRNTWTTLRPDGLAVELEMQKSLYADGYYFNTRVATCYSDRVYQNEDPASQLLEWQLLSEAERQAFLDDVLVPHMRRLLELPQEALWGAHRPVKEDEA